MSSDHAVVPTPNPEDVDPMAVENDDPPPLPPDNDDVGGVDDDDVATSVEQALIAAAADTCTMLPAATTTTAATTTEENTNAAVAAAAAVAAVAHGTDFLDLTAAAAAPAPTDAARASTPPPAAQPPALGAFDPSTPGKVVETGMEHTGRWTREEHEAFLNALHLFGKEWKKVAAKVKTRTVVQTRTHAQKYFQKLQKSLETGGGTDIEMGLYMGEGRKTPATKRKGKQTPGSTVSTVASAKINRRGSQTTMSAAHVISSLSAAKTYAGNYNAAGEWAAPSHMKITAPDPNDPRGKFPEPSPAATGKRKLAEIAAAHMLVGVGKDEKNGDATSIVPPAPPYPSLQIVNPESLDRTHARMMQTGDSPTTPWDGELEALVHENSRRSSRQHSSVSAKIRAIVTGSSPSQVHPINGPSDAFGRNAIHQAVCSGNVLSLSTLLQNEGAADQLRTLDEAGYSPIHTACAVFLPQINQPMGVRNELTRLLLDAGTDANIGDRRGNTPLHWAARTGDTDSVSELLRHQASVDSLNEMEETPLHWAMRTGMRGTKIVALLLENRTRPSHLNKMNRRPMDVAAEGFDDQEGSIAWYTKENPRKHQREFKKALKMTNGERRDSRANLFIRSDHSRTLILHHPECLDHLTKSESDWEAPDRVTTILSRIATPGIYPHEVTISTDFEKAQLDVLSRVHSTEYLSFVSKLSKDLEKKVKETGAYDSEAAAASVVPFTPMVQRTMVHLDTGVVKDGSMSDTAFGAGSLRASRRAAGAVQHAVNCVLVGRNRNAFCIVRPPGHHAGINGLLDDGESCGFCIFNNVASGALHAIEDDKLLCNRCAIVDIDVHHGNGTEEIVRRCNDPSKLFFFSIHLFDNDKKKKSPGQFPYKFYPGTGDEDDLALNIINVPICPLWKDPKPAAADAASAEAKTHGTRSKRARIEDHPESEQAAAADDPVAIAAAAAAAANTTEENISGTSASKSPLMQSGREAYRQSIQNRLLPALRAFNPDLILISAGFDACKNDVGNARHERGGEKIGLDLEPEDYAWTTRKILEIGDICCQGRVVSVLEGGYGRSVDGTSLDRTQLGECALRHLHSLIDPYDSENRFTE